VEVELKDGRLAVVLKAYKSNGLRFARNDNKKRVASAGYLRKGSPAQASVPR
jgi:hypothetical protein